MTAFIAIVHPYFRGDAQSRDDYIEFAIMVKVPNCSAPVPPSRLFCEPRFTGEGTPFPICRVSKDCVLLVHCNSDRHVWRSNISTTDEDVLPAIIVEISDIHAVSRHGIAQSRHSTSRCDLSKSTFSIVLIHGESLVLQSGNDDVWKSVIVEVAKICPHTRDEISVLGQGHPGFKCNLVELAISLVVKQKIEELIVGYEYIGQAVAVVVGNTHTHALAQVRPDSRFGRYVYKFPVSFV